MKVQDIPGINQLSTSEKMSLIEELWDDISMDETNIPVPQSHIDEIERRLEKHKENPSNLLTLEELQERINRQK
jgi:putative addiction module component (TIGR02574 family)